MKRISMLLTLVLSVVLATIAADAQNLEVGQKFELERLVPDAKPGVTTLVVFTPSLTYDNEYASMMTQGFYYYFDQRLAFTGNNFSPKLETRIVYVVGDKQDENQSILNIMGSAKAIYDENGSLFRYFGLQPPQYKNSDSTVVLVDKSGTVAFIDRTYRSQGEHLKPLENKIKELHGIRPKVASPASAKALQIGDEAPNFRVNDKEMLSDLRGSVVLLSFYPAAFSGIIPRTYQSSDTTRGVELATVNFQPRQMDLMVCALQISSLDRIKKSEKKEKRTSVERRIAISNSSPLLLQNWHGLLRTTSIEYASDPDFAVSMKYGAYNPLGYSNRVSVIIDKKGKIAYVDTDYSLEDESVLDRKLAELQQRGK